MKKALIAVAFLALGATLASAQRPARNVSPGRHPNLAAAQRLCQDAFEKIVVAQKVNEFDMNGHAQKAKELLEQASNELKQAAEASNEHR
jgi:ABC-type uncharacterized transport system substrate-binding protein